MAKVALLVAISLLTYNLADAGFEVGTTFIIRSATSNLAFDVNYQPDTRMKPNPVLAVKPNGDTLAQLWTVKPTGRSDGTYNIMPKIQDQEGVNVVLEYNYVFISPAIENPKVANQAWATVPTSCGNWLIQSTWNEDCIQFIGHGGPLVLFACNETNPHQLWQIFPEIA